MRSTVLAATLVALLAVPSFAQLNPPPKLNYVHPPGGKAGTTFEVYATGADLGTVESLHFSFPGVKVETDSSDVKKIDATKKTKGMVAAGPQTAQKFTVTLPANAPLGIHDVRLVSKAGVSNPRAFVVGDLNEVLEKEPNDDAPPKSQKIDLNTTVNGIILTATDVDYYEFDAKKGQRVVISCLASSIDSRLPAFIELYGPNGRYLGSNKNYNGNDALVDARISEDGSYYVRVVSFSHTQGGADYFYRLTVSTRPVIDAVVPATVEAGKDTQVTVFGRNLPGGKLDPKVVADRNVLESVKVTVKAPKNAAQRLATATFITPNSGFLDGFDFTLKNDAGTSAPVLIGVAQYPVVVASGANTDLAKAQAVPVPCEVSGTIMSRGEAGFYRFSVKKGDTLALDVLGDRIGSLTDLRFQLFSPKGDAVTDQDESAEVPLPYFYNRSDDPGRYKFTAAMDGDYVLKVSGKDSTINFGARCGYVVRIGPDEADFRLVAMQGNTTVQEGPTTGQESTYAYTLLVLRIGDFNRDIVITGENLPAGVTVKPQTIPAGVKVANVGVTATKSAAPFVGAIKLVGTATVAGKKLEREVRSASVTWTSPVATVPTISRLDHELVFAVRDKAAYVIQATAEPIKISLGDSIKIPVKYNGLLPEFKGTVQVAPAIIPPGYGVTTPLTLGQGKDSGVLVLDPKANAGTAQPGVYSIILRGQTNPVVKPNVKPQGPNVIQNSEPITIIVAPKALGKLTAGSAAGTPTKLAAGKEIEVPIRFARIGEFDGPLEVVAVPPASTKGISAMKLTIKPGEEDGKLIFKADAGQPPGLHQFVVKGVGRFLDAEVAHEAKLQIVITK